MATWLQKIVLSVVAVVPVIVGEIVRVTDDGIAEDVVLISPRPDPCVDRGAPGALPIPPTPSEAPEIRSDAASHGC